MKKILTAIISICSVFDLTAQSRALSFVQKFDAYQAILPQAKLHLVFNQDKYSPGDTAYFKAYFLKEDFAGIAGKQLIDLNLVDAKGESRLHLMFNVTNGEGQNQMAIPRALSPGIYLVTAHSSWMKNFDPIPFFKKEITVVSRNTIITNQKPIISAIPEGGHLIKGLSTKVCVRTSRSGSTVKITNEAGQEINRTTADLNGLCSIILKPAPNIHYFASVVGDSTQFRLPVVENDGCGIQLTLGKNEQPTKILIISPAGSAFRNQELALVVSSRGKIYHTASVKQGSQDYVELPIPQKDLPEGIIHVSLLSPNGTLLASRDFYNSPEISVQAKIRPSKNVYRVREKVIMEVSLVDKAGLPVKGEFSLSVLNAGLFDSEGQNAMPDEVAIFAGASERIRLDRSDPAWLSTLDDYMIAATEDIPWKKIVSNVVPKPRYSFSNFVQKNGRAYFAETMAPVPDLTTIMFYLQRSKIRYQTTAEKGKVWLAIPDLFGQDEMFYFGETFFYFGGERHGQEISNLKIEWEDEQITLPRAPASRESDSPDRYADFTSKRRLIDRSYNFYASPVSVDSSRSNGGIDIETEIKGADVNLNIQKYIIFPTMAELVKEVIPSLQHRVSNGKDNVRVSLSEGMTASATGDPVYIIDGIATKSTPFFLSLKPADLLSIKIITDPSKLLRFNLLGKNGIVIVTTKNGDARVPLDDQARLIQGLNTPVNFHNSWHENTADHRRPDFRSTIYWNPAIKTDANGKSTIEFFCSDDIGPLSIRVSGLADGRRPFSATDKVEVVGDPRQ